MHYWLKRIAAILACGAVLAVACLGAESAPADTAAAALQAIEQAPDPSAVVAAYASGFAAAPNDPRLQNAYITRMVDMGLPEMAFHQAQTLTTLEPQNGLAWGVVAFVDARRGQMTDAVSAINLAAQFTPTNGFVAHTAGEVLAWYDLKADKTQLPPNARDGLARTRSLLEKKPEFAEAYDTAKKAYEAQTNTTPSSSGEGANAQAGASPDASAYAPQWAATNSPPATVTYVAPYTEPYYTAGYYPSYYAYVPDYYYGWGPGWVAPTPWCWWQPFGYWSGPVFCSFGLTFAFGCTGNFHHGYHDHGYYHGDHGPYYAGFAHGHDPVFWHHGKHGTSTFFSAPSRPSQSLVHWSRAAHQAAPATLGAFHSSPTVGHTTAIWGSSATHWWSVSGRHSLTPTTRHVWVSPRPNTATTPAPAVSGSAASAFRGNLRQSGTRNGRHSVFAPQNHGNPLPFASGRAAASQRRSSSGLPRVAPVPQVTQTAPSRSVRTFSNPRRALPASPFFGGQHSSPFQSGSWSRMPRSTPAPAIRSYSGGFSRGKSSSSSGFHSMSHGSGRPFSGSRGFGGGFHGGGFGGGFRGGHR